jgi:hypothetical protein
MRLSSILIALATLLAAPVAAQEGAVPHAARSVRPLPAELAPRATEPAERGRAALHPVEIGGLTGMLVGMAVGGIYGSATYDDRCGDPEDGCTLGRGMDTGVFALIGGSLGGLIGAGTGALLGLRGGGGVDAPLTRAPVTLALIAGGAVRVEVRLRH